MFIFIYMYIYIYLCVCGGMPENGTSGSFKGPRLEMGMAQTRFSDHEKLVTKPQTTGVLTNQLPSGKLT